MSESIRYIVWDFNQRVSIEYERLGECNGCGACCYARVAFDVREAIASEDFGQEGGQTTDGKGVWAEWRDGDTSRYFRFHPVDTSVYSKCPMLTYTNKCLLHANGKRLIHYGWPFSPANVTPFPTCSYSFKEVSRLGFS